MRRPIGRLAAACALAAATAVFCGSALAGGGNGNGNNGNGNGNGGAQQSSQSQQQQQHGNPHAAAASSNGSGTGSGSASHGVNSGSSGVKPSSSTTHWTHCVTGTSSSGVTCTSSDNGHTPQSGADVSKRYGNGKTAAQIAESRGGNGVQLTGPGNSQPHKVCVCGKPCNKSGGVDVHAVKSYSGTCGAVHPTAPPVSTPIPSISFCMNGTLTTQPENVVVASYLTGANIVPPFTYNGQTYSYNWPSGEATFNNHCVAPAAAAQLAPAATVTTTTTVPVTTTAAVAATTTVAAATPTTATVAAAAKTGPAKSGVLGAVTSLKKPSAHHGVLGAVTHIASSTLPFTGFPVWLAVLIALALILAGVTLRRRALGTRP